MSTQKERYDKRMKHIEDKVNGNFISEADGFQCPYNGWDCNFKWDKYETGMIWAEPIDESFDNEMFDNYTEEQKEEYIETTYEFCNDFGTEYAETTDEANDKIHEKVSGCWFMYDLFEEGRYSNL